MDSFEKRIRKRAYDLWERAGCPQGRSEAFWFAAAEEAIQASEARYRAIVDSSPAAIICIDENGIVQSANPATKTILGYEADELLGANVSKIMPDYHASRHNGYIDAYLETGVGKIIGIGREVTARRKDGGMIDVELSVGEWRDDAGRRFFAGALRDISARKRAEEELARTRRLESASRLTAGFAHDFNNLLTVLAGEPRADPSIDLRRPHSRPGPTGARGGRDRRIPQPASAVARKKAAAEPASRQPE